MNVTHWYVMVELDYLGWFLLIFTDDFGVVFNPALGKRGIKLPKTPDKAYAEALSKIALFPTRDAAYTTAILALAGIDGLDDAEISINVVPLPSTQPSEGEIKAWEVWQ